MTKLFNFLPKFSYSLVLVSFLLPFFLVECNNQELMTVKGYTLLIGGKPDSVVDKLAGIPSLKDDKKTPEQQAQKDEKNAIKPHPIAISIFLLALTGLILCFINFAHKETVLYLISAIGIGLLVYLASNFDMGLGMASEAGSKEYESMKSMLKIKTQMGYYLSLIGFVLIFVEWVCNMFSDDY